MNVRLLANVNVPERCMTITVTYFRRVVAFCGGTELLWQIVPEKDLSQVKSDYNARLRASSIFEYVHVHAHAHVHVNPQ